MIEMLGSGSLLDDDGVYEVCFVLVGGWVGLRK